MNKAIVFIDTYGVLNNSKSSDFLRHVEYAKYFNDNFQGDIDWYIITSNLKNNTDADIFNLLNVRGKLEIIKQIKFSLILNRISDKYHGSILVITGDPYANSFPLLISHVLFKKKIQFQLQLHGDPFYPNYDNRRIKNKIKKFLLFVSSRFANSYRTVSAGILIDWQDFTKSKHLYDFWTPVPLDKEFISNIALNNSKLSDQKQQKFINIGISGRIEKDRGLDIIVSTLRVLVKNFDVKVHISGSGNQKEKFISLLRKFIKPENLYEYGHLTQTEIIDYYSHIDVLLSCAPTESYGRTMREAYLLGSNILAYKSRGSLEFEKEVNSVGIAIFDSSSTELEISSKFNEIRNRRLISRIDIENANCNRNDGIFALTNSWNRILESI